MNKFAVFVLGPAGTGKTTFCQTMIDHFLSTGKTAHLVNLDPAVEQNFDRVKPTFDIRTKWPLHKIMKDLSLGPNGGLVECLRLMIEDRVWLESKLEGYSEEFLFVDCPGQIEVYLHSHAMQDIIDIFKANDYSICIAFLIDSQFLTDNRKFFGAVLNTLSAMLQLELPHVNIITKMDLISPKNLPTGEEDEENETFDDEAYGEDYDERMSRFFYPDVTDLEQSESKIDRALAEVIDKFNLVSYIPLDIHSKASIKAVIANLNIVLQNDDLDLSGPDGQENYP